MNDGFKLLSAAGAVLTLLVTLKAVQGKELEDAEKAAAAIGVITAVGPWVAKGLS